MIDKSKPLNLGEIFNVTIKLIGKTFTRNIIIAAVFLIPAGIVFSYGMNSFFNSLIEITQPSIRSVAQFNNLGHGIDFFTVFGIYIATAIVFILGYLAMLIGITHVSCKELDGVRISLTAAFEKIFSVTYLRSLGQVLLLILAFVAFIIVAVFLTFLTGITNSTSIKILGVLVVIIEFFFLVFLYIRWYFAFIAVVREDVNPLHSFVISNNLVKGYWWRTFGLIILTSITAQFVVSFVTTPFSFIIMWDFIAQYFKMLTRGHYYRNSPYIFLELLRSLGFSLGIIIIISSILQSLITPLFNVVLYYDLKIRKKEFPIEPTEIAVSPLE